MKNNFETIDDVICDYLDQKNKGVAQARGLDYWAASSLGHCMRYQVLNRSGIMSSGKPNYAWRNAAQDGHSAHVWRQLALEHMGVLVDSEKSITDEELHYRGHYDLVVDLSGKIVLGDIKTQNNKAFMKRSRLPDKVDPQHKRQLGSYFYFLRRDVFPALSSARLYYVNKDKGVREEIEILFEESYLMDIVKELKTLNLYWDKRILPKKEKESFCYICPFRDLCDELHNKKDTTIDYAIQRSLYLKTK